MATQIKTHTLMFDEILALVNASDDVHGALQGAMFTPYFKNYMNLLVSDVWTTIDISNVKFTQYDYPRSMAGAMLLSRQSWNIVNGVIMMESVRDSVKEKQFKALSEMLYVGESKILYAILNKDLTPLYPNITFDKIFDAVSADVS